MLKLSLLIQRMNTSESSNNLNKHRHIEYLAFPYYSGHCFFLKEFAICLELILKVILGEIVPVGEKNNMSKYREVGSINGNEERQLVK